MRDEKGIKAACKKGIYYYNEIIEYVQIYAEFYMLKAIMLQEINKLELAEDCFNYAIDLDENYAEGYFMRGKFYMSQDKEVEALKDLKKAIELSKQYKEKAENDEVYKKIIEKLQIESSDSSEVKVDMITENILVKEIKASSEINSNQSLFK